MIFNADDDLMVTAAHRYCLGRRSYIVNACTGWLRNRWPQISRKTRNIILRDTIEALARGEAGGGRALRDWSDLVAFAVPHLDDADYQWLRDAVRYMGEPALKLAYVEGR